MACAERPVWFAAKLPATAQAPNTLFTFDQHRGEEARCSNEENKGVVVGNVSAACTDNKCAALSTKSGEFEDWRKLGSVRTRFMAFRGRIVVA